MCDVYSARTFVTKYVSVNTEFNLSKHWNYLVPTWILTGTIIISNRVNFTTTKNNVRARDCKLVVAPWHAYYTR